MVAQTCPRRAGSLRCGRGGSADPVKIERGSFEAERHSPQLAELPRRGSRHPECDDAESEPCVLDRQLANCSPYVVGAMVQHVQRFQRGQEASEVKCNGELAWLEAV